jgi:hypothetical protein
MRSVLHNPASLLQSCLVELAALGDERPDALKLPAIVQPAILSPTLLTAVLFIASSAFVIDLDGKLTVPSRHHHGSLSNFAQVRRADLAHDGDEFRLQDCKNRFDAGLPERSQTPTVGTPNADGGRAKRERL